MIEVLKVPGFKKERVYINKSQILVDGRDFGRGGQTSLDDPAEYKKLHIDDVLWAVKKVHEEGQVIFRKSRQKKEADSSIT